MNFVEQSYREKVFLEHLAPLIIENFRLREAKKLPDEWFWADEIGVRWLNCPKIREWYHSRPWDAR